MKKTNLARVHALLLNWYKINGRTALPWRRSSSPYYTLVSEFMAQQTQIERVIPKFEEFVRHFPDVAALAQAPAAAVLRAWKGLGYNSRAIRLKQVAEVVIRTHDGAIPSEKQALEQLPGIGPYTAAAIRVFAFKIDDAAIDTNVRRVVGRLFFGERVSANVAREIDRMAASIVPPGRADDWHSALMDLGSTICNARSPKCLLCPLQSQCISAPIDTASLQRRRAGSTPPVRYETTARYARGRLIDRLRELPPGERISLLDLRRDLEPVLADRSSDDVSALVSALEKDGLIVRSGEHVSLPE